MVIRNVASADGPMDSNCGRLVVWECNSVASDDRTEHRAEHRTGSVSPRASATTGGRSLQSALAASASGAPAKSREMSWVSGTI